MSSSQVPPQSSVKLSKISLEAARVMFGVWKVMLVMVLGPLLRLQKQWPAVSTTSLAIRVPLQLALKFLLHTIVGTPPPMQLPRPGGDPSGHCGKHWV